MSSAAHDVGSAFELKLQSLPGTLAEARKSLEAYAIKSGWDDKSAGEIGLVFNEAVANVMRHAYHGATDQPILVRAEQIGDAFKISIRDWGTGINPQELPQRDHDPLTPGGVGMICLRRLMDEVVFTRQPDGMLLSMTRRKRP